MRLTLLAVGLGAAASAGCAVVQRPQTFHLRCPAPPAATSPSVPLPVVPATEPDRPVPIGTQFNRHGNVVHRIVPAELGATLAADVAALLGTRAADPNEPGDRLELRLTRAASNSEAARWTELRGPVRSELDVAARLFRAGAAPVELSSFHGEAEKRVAYIDASDHAETLERAYCALLADFAARAPALRAALTR